MEQEQHTAHVALYHAQRLRALVGEFVRYRMSDGAWRIGRLIEERSNRDGKTILFCLMAEPPEGCAEFTAHLWPEDIASGAMAVEAGSWRDARSAVFLPIRPESFGKTPESGIAPELRCPYCESCSLASFAVFEVRATDEDECPFRTTACRHHLEHGVGDAMRMLGIPRAAVETAPLKIRTVVA